MLRTERSSEGFGTPGGHPWVSVLSFGVAFHLHMISIAQGQTARQIAQQAFPSVVLLVMGDASGKSISIGSGFFVSEDLVATNYHVVAGTTTGVAKIIGQKTAYPLAGAVALDSMRDLAIVKVNGAKAPALVLGDDEQAVVGDEVYAIGNPEGLEGTLSKGIVSGIRLVRSRRLLQITAAISEGSSGGPVLDSAGRVIGIAVATLMRGQNLNFAVPVSDLRSLIANVGAVTAFPEGRAPHGSEPQERLPQPQFPPRRPPQTLEPPFASAAADQIYSTALTDYTKQSYDLSIRGFQAFIAQFPRDSRVPDAQFWLANAYYAQQNYPLAIREFEVLIRDYPDNSKTPSAMLNQGRAYLESNDATGCRVLRDLTTKYARTRQATLARDALKQAPQCR